MDEDGAAQTLSVSVDNCESMCYECEMNPEPHLHGCRKTTFSLGGPVKRLHYVGGQIKVPDT